MNYVNKDEEVKMVIKKTTIFKPQSEIAKAKAPKRCAAYARVSTEEEAQGESFDSQVSFYRKLIQNDLSCSLVDIYGDRGISGTSAKERPEFLRLIKDCEEDKIDFVYVKSISRFARNAAECMEYLDRVSEHGVVVYFQKENIYSDDKNLSVILKILATLAQEESNSLSMAQRWSYYANAKIGRPTRVVAYGYKKVTEGKNRHKWVVDPDEARRVKKAFILALKGLTQKEIAEELNKMEQEESTGEVWNHTRIDKMLKNEVYIGTIVTNKTVTVDYVTKKSVRNDGIAEKVCINDHHEAIVSEYIFNAVAEELATRRRGKYVKHAK